MELRLSGANEIAMTTFPQPTDLMLDALINDIRANLDKPLRLRDLEAQTFYSRRWLHDAFRRRLGSTPMQWVREQRLAKARDLLQAHGSEISIQAVALACGYRHTGQLSVLFKRRYGVSPSQVQRGVACHG
jgi:transcriptional regulator GlxA family with amidase domain